MYHHAFGDAEPYGEALEFLGFIGAELDDCESTPTGVSHPVVAGEDGDNLVADESVDIASVLVDDARFLVQNAVEHDRYLFRSMRLGVGGEPSALGEKENSLDALRLLTRLQRSDGSADTYFVSSKRSCRPLDHRTHRSPKIAYLVVLRGFALPSKFPDRDGNAEPGDRLNGIENDAAHERSG